MNKPIFFLLACLLSAISYAQHSHPGGGTDKPAVLVSGMGSHRHPVSTKNAMAQKFFDQGMAYIFAFNHDEAIRSFRRASELDPDLAMAHWGIAYALGPNINLDVDPAREKAAYLEVQKALTMSSKASENERDYIQALARRYTDDPKADLRKLAEDYKYAMAALVKKYPDDLDLATLYAESMMDLNPWKLWTNDGKPAEGTEEIVAVLESVLRRDPIHVGANHYYIHAVEASPNPERALPSAERMKTLVPAAGHLVHMPAHIYIRTGFYSEAAQANRQAIRADEAHFARTNQKGVYPVMYYYHNIHFLYFASAMEGKFAASRAAADRVTAVAAPYVKEMPMAEGYVPTSAFVLLRFRKWKEVLDLPEVAAGMSIAKSARRFARGLAFARTGKLTDAQKERESFLQAAKTISSDAVVGFNPAANVLKVAEFLLDAEIAWANQDSKAVDLFRKAVKAEDELSYYEPPDWYYPIRETLGGALLQKGDAVEAEKVFREDLAKNVRNGRSLFGLMKALEAQGKTADAASVQKQFETAWKNADTKLRVEDL